MSTPTTRVAFHTMGCKTNFSETSTISREMMTYGLQQVSFRDTADVYVLNSCSVTENANKEARKLIRQARRRNCLLYTSPSPRDRQKSRMPSSA